MPISRRSIARYCMIFGFVCFNAAAWGDDKALPTTELSVIDVDIDWTSTRDSEKIADLLTSRGEFSYPIIFIDRKLVGLVPSQISISKGESPINLEIGISQLLERPLYEVELSPNQHNGYDASITTPVLSLLNDKTTISITEIVSSVTAKILPVSAVQSLFSHS